MTANTAHLGAVREPAARHNKWGGGDIVASLLSIK